MGKREKKEPGREKTGVGFDEASGKKNGGGIDRRGMLKVLGAAGVTVTGLGSLQAAETAESGDPFGAQLAGPFSRAVGIGLSPCSDSLCLATRPTLPGRSLFTI